MLRRDTAATLELLIHEILTNLDDSAYPDDRSRILAAKRTIRGWVETNDLHPEDVRSLTEEEFQREFSTTSIGYVAALAVVALVAGLAFAAYQWMLGLHLSP
jgi:hypothetical protein